MTLAVLLQITAWESTRVDRWRFNVEAEARTSPR